MCYFSSVKQKNINYPKMCYIPSVKQKNINYPKMCYIPLVKQHSNFNLLTANSLQNK
jgi:hypothetical protein